MSHLTDLARAITDGEDDYARTGDRAACERARDAALSLVRQAQLVAARLSDELDRAEIRSVYDNDRNRRAQ